MAWMQLVQQWVKDQSHWTGRYKKSWPSTWWWYQEQWGGEPPSPSYCEKTRTQMRQTVNEREHLRIKLQSQLRSELSDVCLGGKAKRQLNWGTTWISECESSGEWRCTNMGEAGCLSMLEVVCVGGHVCVQMYLKERPLPSESMKAHVLMAFRNEQISSEQELN